MVESGLLQAGVFWVYNLKSRGPYDPEAQVSEKDGESKEGNLASNLTITVPSAQKRIQMKIWRLYFAFAFVMERQINSPRFSFAFAFVMVMLGTQKPQQQATLTK